MPAAYIGILTILCDTHYCDRVTEYSTETHLQEVRRGTVVLASLLSLREADYGYRLLETLDAAGFAVDANTLYPLLRRLERQGLLTSDWNTDEARPRKYYTTSSAGIEVAQALLTDWHRLTGALEALADPEETG